MTRSLSVLFVLVLLLGLGACDCSDETSDNSHQNDAGAFDDVSTSDDTGELADTDGPGQPDAQIDLDTGAQGDTGSGQDTGDSLDTGIDTGTDPDAGETFEDEACGLYQAECEGVCIPVSMDPTNCGGCGITCDEGEVCSGGQCVDSSQCPGTLTACGGACTDTIYDSDNCGLCDNACGEGEGCAGGQCVAQVEVGPSPEFCADGGPVIDFDQAPSSPTSCAGDLAESTFRWGLCGCDGILTGDEVFVDAYDSSIGPYTPDGPGGGVGTNGKYIGDSALTLTGTLWATGDERMPVEEEFETVGVYLDDPLTIGQRLYTGADLVVDENVFVSDDAYVGGDIDLSGSTIEVSGDLYMQPGSSINGTANYENFVEEAFNIGPACAFCAPEDPIDIAGMVEAYESANDNALIGLDPGALAGSSGNIRLELPCGHYYLDEINTDGPTTIIATGHTALFIGGDITANNELTISLTPDARFDVFVAGSFESNNPFRLGSPNYPGLMRMYIGGDDGFESNTEIQVGGYIYAVPGGIVTNNEIEIFGGLHGQFFESNNAVEIHYDRRVATVGRECPDPNNGDDPGGDNGDDPDAGGDDPDAGGDDPDTGGDDPDAGGDNGDTPGSQCLSSGQSCQADGDCCAPLTCNDGQCGLLSCLPAFEACTDGAQCCSGVCTGAGGSEGVCIVN